MSNQDEAKLVLEAVVMAARNAGVSRQGVQEAVNTALSANPNSTWAVQTLNAAPERPFLRRFLKMLLILP